jgi:suppressor of G2 allele of SKP1
MSAQEKFECAKGLFNDGRYAESQAALNEILASSADDAALAKQVNMWLRKCALHVPATAPAGEAPVPPPPGPQAPSAASSSSAVRFEWFQSASSLTFTFYVKGRQAGDVAVSMHGERSVEVTIKLDESGREYQYHAENLFAAVSPSPSVSVRSMKVEVVLSKVVSYTWPALEVKQEDAVKIADEKLLSTCPATTAAATAPPTAAQLSYPNSKGKDWSKVSLDEKEGEGDEKPSGDHALNALFKQIYGNATDDQRRAMMKSYQESNGTVLSTNWAEVGSKFVKGEPPKGMEMKPMNE